MRSSVFMNDLLQIVVYARYVCNTQTVKLLVRGEGESLEGMEL